MLEAESEDGVGGGRAGRGGDGSEEAEVNRCIVVWESHTESYS